MVTTAPSPRFQLDVRRYELLDGGRRVRLERQPMEVLILLTQRHGELATREEIATALWPTGVHVDTDQNINRIVRKLRRALHDDPEAPQFIETVVGKGYRFVGPVEVLDRPPAPQRQEPPDRPFDRASTATQLSAKGLRLLVAIGVLALAAAWLLRGTGRVRLAEPTLTPLTSYLGDEQSPTFSPDGNHVAFAWNGERRDNWDIYVTQVGLGTPPRRLTDDPADDRMASWSPDGRQIAFERQQGTQFAIYLISPLGGPERKLTDWLRVRQASELSPATWSPDGKWLVAAELDGETSHIVLVPAGPGEKRWLLSSPVAAGIYVDPVIAPDGSAVAYDLCKLSETCHVNVLELGQHYVPKGSPQSVTRDGHRARGLAWTRDGGSLVYGDGLSRRLWRVPRVGGSSERLELAGTGSAFPALSRLGNRLAYVHSGWEIHLWEFAAGGTAAPESFLPSTLPDTAPQFSPDGRKVVFGSDRAGNGRQVWVASQDGSNPIPLTDATGRQQGTPRWSPDSRWIAYDAQEEDGQRQVYVIEATGGLPRRVGPFAFDQSLPSWSRDGKWIYFRSSRTGRSEIWRVPFGPAGAAEQVTTSGAFAGLESCDGASLFYTKNDALDEPVFAGSLSGGDERQVVDAVYRWDFFPVDRGLYYIMRPDPRRRPYDFELRVKDFASGRTVVLNKFTALDVVGLTVSPDRQIIVSSGVRASAGSDLMLIQNFR